MGKIAIKRTLDKLEDKDAEFGAKQHKMSGTRVWLRDRIVEWKQKVATMDKIIIDFKNEEKARMKKAKWAEIKAKAGYGGNSDQT